MHRKQNSKKQTVFYSILAIVVVLVLCVIFFFPINNAIRNATGNDTASDKMVKSELAKKIKDRKTGDPKADEKIDKSARILEGVKMSEIMKAANNQQSAAKLIEKTSSMSPEASQKAAQEIFTNPQFDQIRQSMSDGDWVKTYQNYQDLSKNGSIGTLRQELGQ
ncbi:hypothetical protein [Companilactobacillus zhongbaensis]|uniref:hypothetical protein n=1 Tax=Companilactobacillus zhongbaensis TaxID=2486009 RepID=UPI000F78ADB6|nr:hypothetical protein [Companilactobacillus zhongbaensis]